MAYIFESKARTLKFLEDKILKGKILPQITFTLNDWMTGSQDILKRVQESFDRVIVRSSCCGEDSIDASMAGAFDSFLDVDARGKELRESIEKVITSYGNSNPLNEVLIQPFLKEVQCSGVAFTADPDTLGNYYIINYDENGSTDSVTSGTSTTDKTFVLFKGNTHKKNFEPWLNNLIESLDELETIFGSSFLDVEFAISSNHIFILQVRPIVKKGKKDLSNVDLAGSLERLERKIKKLSCTHPRVLGSRAFFGVMPDWNPAEIIGLRPGRLSLSLYKELVTDSIWAYQRHNYGYRNLRSHPLMVTFLGVPYIDVRLSFNSFVPFDLDEATATKLIDYYLDELDRNPHHHDKVEFEIVMSCYIMGMDKKRDILQAHGFSRVEIDRIFQSLKKLTLEIINPQNQNGVFLSDIEKVRMLQKSYDQIVNSELSLVDKIYWLIEDCKRYGTLPFAGIARSGFIATQMLNSFVAEEGMSPEEREAFLGSIKTVSKMMCHDYTSLPRENFLKIYGHLRPGTYDLLSPRYDEDFEGYFSQSAHSNSTYDEFNPSAELLNRLQKLLHEVGITYKATDVLHFIRLAIEYREWSKFVFTKSLSKALELIEEYGKKLGINKEDMAFVDYSQIKALYSSLESEEVGIYFRTNIQQNMREFALTQVVKLPSLIRKSEDIYFHIIDKALPNFVTLKKIKGKIVVVTPQGENITGKIALISSADPGYDYLFTKNIIGLITCYGGTNSHMAVRCAELGIPAAIGVGELLYSKMEKAVIVEIDALNRQLKVIQ